MSETQKHTKPNVPNLRFPGFEGEWKTVSLGDLFEIGSSKRIFESQWRNTGIPFYRTREIVSLINGTPFSSPIFIDENLFKDFIRKYGDIQAGDMLVTGVGTIGQMYVVPETNKFYFKDGNVIWFKHNPSISSYFIKHLFSTKTIVSQLQNNASITTVATYTIEGAKKTKAIIPSKSEQDKIASFLNLLDERISIQSKVIEDLKKLKAALCELLYDESEPNSLIGDIIEQISTRNKKGEQFNVLSVSNQNGFVEQSEQFEGRTVASQDTSNYKIVSLDDFAYNPARINVGSLARLKEIGVGIVSPMYVCFRCKQGILPDYLESFFDTDYFYFEMEKRLEGSVRMCLSFEGLCNIPLFIPNLKEQKTVVSRIQVLKDKIRLEGLISKYLSIQKQVLLSKLVI